MPTHRIKLNEKFAFMAVTTAIEDTIADISLDDTIRVVTKLPLPLDDEWRGWIGSLRAEHLEEDCNLFLYASLISQTAAVLDGENQELSCQVARLFEALTFTGPYLFHGAPVRATGARDQFHTSLRQIGDIGTPLLPGGVRYLQIGEQTLQEAYTLAQALAAFEKFTQYDRVQRIFHIFSRALREHHQDERLHQFCRCVEGFILPKIGSTKSQFLSRTELFIGPRHHTTIGRLYDMRSWVEHMHEYSYPPATPERERRLDIMRMSALAEALARYCIRSFLGNRALWPHYATKDALAAFWQLPPEAKRKIWGPPTDLSILDSSFDPSLLDDESLGIR